MGDKEHSLVEHVVTEVVVHTVLETVCEHLGTAYSFLSSSPVNEGEDRWVAEQGIANAEYREAHKDDDKK